LKKNSFSTQELCKFLYRTVLTLGIFDGGVEPIGLTFGKKQSFFPNETINKLTDSYLLDEYKKCKSVQKIELLII
jgi:hypothetical protein